MQNVYPVGLFFSNTQDFAFAPFEKMPVKKTCKLSTSTYPPLKVWLKEVLITITEKTLKWVQV